MADTQPKGPYRLVTVNTAPERARRLIARLVEALQDRYTIIHVDNCESNQIKIPQAYSSLHADSDTAIEEVEPKVKQHQPDLLVRQHSG